MVPSPLFTGGEGLQGHQKTRKFASFFKNFTDKNQKAKYRTLSQAKEKKIVAISAQSAIMSENS
jgi:hypothetical protein